MNVTGRPEMSGRFIVGPNGRVVIPALGDMPAAGMTRGEFDAVLRERIGTVLKAAGAPAAPLPPMATGLVEAPLQPLAPGDTLDIAVQGEPELTRRYLVMENGSIYVSYIGEVRAAGVPLSQLLAQIALRLREFIVEPIVSISDAQRAPRWLYISGAVGVPGKYSYWEYPTLLSLLAGAGGITEEAEPAGAMLVRGGQKTRLRLDEILDADVADQGDVALLPDDRITVPTREVSLVHVLGRVTLSGAWPLQDGDRISSLIARAGGVAPGADLAHAGVLRGAQWLPVDLEAVLRGDAPEQDLALQAGDTIVVPDKKGQFHIAGAVGTPGTYSLQLADSVLEALSISGGIRPDAAGYNAFIVRGAEAIALDLDALMNSGDPALDVQLQDGDKLVVPEAKRTVFVWGQVPRPGAYPIRPGDTYMDLIGQAGGLLPAGRHKKILIVRRGAGEDAADHVELRELAALDPSDERSRPQPGDLVYVPTKQELARERWLQWFAGIVSGALLFRR